MTRRSWIVNPKPPYNLIPAEEYVREEKSTFHIMPDMPDFVSPIDGKVVRGRRGYREHCKMHRVTNISDYKEEWKKPRRNPVREDKAGRVEALKQAYDLHQRKR